MRPHARAMICGCLIGSLVAVAAIAHVMHRPLFPTPFNLPLDWITFPLCPLVLLGWVPMPHKPEFFTFNVFTSFVIVMNAALYSATFAVLSMIAERVRTPQATQAPTFSSVRPH